MKITAAAFCFVLSTMALAEANEVVEIRAAMMVDQCRYEGDEIDCVKPVSFGKPTVVVLHSTRFPGVSQGNALFETEALGYSFVGRIAIKKIPFGNESRYLLQVFVTHWKTNTGVQQRQSLGDAFVKDMDLLPEILWSGETIRDGSISLTPHILVAAKNADLSFLAPGDLSVQTAEE